MVFINSHDIFDMFNNVKEKAEEHVFNRVCFLYLLTFYFILKQVKYCRKRMMHVH